MLLAIPFKSYYQPFIVMSAIPYGIIGAVFGHLLLGMEFSISVITLLPLVETTDKALITQAFFFCVLNKIILMYS